jgi:hypothetical protein
MAIVIVAIVVMRVPVFKRQHKGLLELVVSPTSAADALNQSSSLLCSQYLEPNGRKTRISGGGGAAR